MIKPNAHIAAMDAYQLADLSVAEGVDLVSLAQNESALPPSPEVVAAGVAAAGSAHLYSDPDWCDLRATIAEVHGLDAEAVLCGAGSLELIASLIACYAGPGDEVLSTQYAYAFFKVASLAAGAAYRAVPEPGLTVSVDELLAGVSARTRIVAIANPGNPTGSRIPRSEVVRLREDLPRDVLLIVDEAYGEFADVPGQFTFDLAGRGDTVILRTFSKVYGLAGARVGWGVFPPAVAAEVRKLLNPNNVSSISQAMAAAAMRDQAYMRTVRSATAESAALFSKRLQALGFDVPQTHTNFVLIPFESAEAALSADRALRAHGILMRAMGGYGLEHCLRATIAGDEQMMQAADVLDAWMRGEAA